MDHLRPSTTPTEVTEDSLTKGGPEFASVVFFVHMNLFGMERGMKKQNRKCVLISDLLEW